MLKELWDEPLMLYIGKLIASHVQISLTYVFGIKIIWYKLTSQAPLKNTVSIWKVFSPKI